MRYSGKACLLPYIYRVRHLALDDEKRERQSTANAIFFKSYELAARAVREKLSTVLKWSFRGRFAPKRVMLDCESGHSSRSLRSYLLRFLKILRDVLQRATDTCQFPVSGKRVLTSSQFNVSQCQFGGRHRRGLLPVRWYKIFFLTWRHSRCGRDFLAFRFSYFWRRVAGLLRPPFREPHTPIDFTITHDSHHILPYPYHALPFFS